MLATRLSVMAVAFGMLVSAQAVRADSTVTLSKMHLCCGACVKAVNSAVDGVEGAQVKVDSDAGSAVITAPDAATAQKAVDAIAAAGFHAQSDSKTVQIKDDSGVKPGQVERIELSGIHNCCGACNRAIKDALGSVDGVLGDTAKAKQSTLVVEGNFDAAKLVKALNAAGFHVKVKSAR